MSMNSLSWVEFRMMVLKWFFLKWNGRSLSLDFRRVSALFWYEVKKHICGFSREENKARWMPKNLVWYREHRSSLVPITLWLLLPPRGVVIRFAESMFLIHWYYILQLGKGKRLQWQLMIPVFLARPGVPISQTSVSFNFSGFRWGMPTEHLSTVYLGMQKSSLSM